MWWWISLSPHHPAQVRCCEVNSVARDGRTGARRVTSRESGLLVPRTRTCKCVDVRAHAGWCAGWDRDGELRVGGLRETRAHRDRGRVPRRTRNPAPASAAPALAPASAHARAVLVDHRASVGLRVFRKHGPLGAFPRLLAPSPSIRWRWLKRGRPTRSQRATPTPLSLLAVVPCASDGRPTPHKEGSGSGLPWSQAS